MLTMPKLKYVPHDNAKLIELQGGNKSFIDRLDFIIDNVCPELFIHPFLSLSSLP